MRKIKGTSRSHDAMEEVDIVGIGIKIKLKDI